MELARSPARAGNAFKVIMMCKEKSGAGKKLTAEELLYYSAKCAWKKSRGVL